MYVSNVCQQRQSWEDCIQLKHKTQGHILSAHVKWCALSLGQEQHSGSQQVNVTPNMHHRVLFMYCT